MKCPVCKLATGFYQWESSAHPGTFDTFPLPLYQRSYVVAPQKGIITCHIMEDGEKPISPRCDKCYDKAIKSLEKKKAKC